MKRWLLIFSVLIGLGVLGLGLTTVNTAGGSPDINVSRYIELNGQQQWIYARGEKNSDPVMLYLHGGPGMIESYFATPQFQGELEKDFIVVHWDQRGSGMSYDPGMDTGLLTLEQLVADTISLAEWLKAHFNREKIILAGHSWGSLIGLEAAKRRPDLFYGYIGIGQMVHTDKGEKISYDFVLEKAKEAHNTEALTELKTIGRPPYADPIPHALVERKWLRHFGGVVRDKAAAEHLDNGLGRFPPYSPEIAQNYLPLLMQNLNILGQDFFTLDFLAEKQEVAIPVWFVSGGYDFNIPTTLSKKLLEHIDAPEKRFVLFEDSAHYPNFEEPEHFARVMREFKRIHIR